MEKIDLKKSRKDLYAPSLKQVSLVDVPDMTFLKVDGQGDPNGSRDLQEATETLFQLSYSLKFQTKKGPLGLDYVVMPLEGLWWSDNMAAFDVDDKSAWKWTLMIRQPEWITPEMVVRAREDLTRKRGGHPLPRVRMESYSEGRAAQIMHLGPFSQEGPTVARVHDFIAAKGLAAEGKHHEIYLSDIRKTDPGRWKTVIRQPVRPG